MQDSGYTKLKLLFIKEFLERHSDENHPVSVEEIQAMLDSHGISCERKSVYSDIKALKEYGVDIISVRSPKAGYCVCSRDFQLPELRLLVDAVQAANFITLKKSKDLIVKITTLCSESQGKSLERQVFITNRAKRTNEEIYYHIDTVSRAIQMCRKIRFVYRKMRLGDGDTIEFDEKEHIVSPYAMIWNRDHYYLVGNNRKYDNLMHVRIDRMVKVEILDESIRPFREVSPYKNYFDSADYSKKTFNMFSGDTEKVSLSCHNSLLDEIVDRFGSDCIIRAEGEDRFVFSTSCVVSDGFVSWLMQFGSKVEVLRPETLKERILERAKEICSLYMTE